MQVTLVPMRRVALPALLGLIAALLLAACGDELPTNTGQVAVPSIDAASEQRTSSDDARNEAAPAADGAGAPPESVADGDSDGGETLGPSGGPGIGAREDTLFEALAAHVTALNALNAQEFAGIFLDDCGDAADAGALSYSFGAPLVEAGGQASTDFQSITFLDTDRALVEYATQLPPDIWVVHEHRWRISTCPQ